VATARKQTPAVAFFVHSPLPDCEFENLLAAQRRSNGFGCSQANCWREDAHALPRTLGKGKTHPRPRWRVAGHVARATLGMARCPTRDSFVDHDSDAADRVPMREAGVGEGGGNE
jgi:hypothetical protein